jgi:hypothetical protein
MGRNIGLTYWCNIFCSVEWVPPTAAVWPLNPTQKKRLSRAAETPDARMDLSNEAKALRLAYAAQLVEKKAFVATQHAKREVHTSATLADNGRTRFSTTTPAPVAGRAEGPHGEDAAHMRFESRPEALRAYLSRMQQLKRTASAGGRQKNTTRKEACKQLDSLRKEVLKHFPGVQEQLTKLQIKAVAQHGGKEVTNCNNSVDTVRVGNFAVTSQNMAFWMFNALDEHDSGSINCDRDPFLWPSYSAKQGRACGDHIEGYVAPAAVAVAVAVAAATTVTPTTTTALPNPHPVPQARGPGSGGSAPAAL